MKTAQQQQDQSQLKWIADFIWSIADDRLRDVYVRGKYRDVILPQTNSTTPGQSWTPVAVKVGSLLTI